jgi:hypothetical protein
MSDRHRQATAVNIVVRIRPLGHAWYRLLFLGARHIAWVTAAMRRQQFIHFCHWMLLDELPSPDGGRRRLRHKVLWFESNYDGDVVRYMDTFARIMPWRMRAAWTPTVGFPDMFPPVGFHQWTVDNAYETTHYWSAYPDASTREVGRALRVLAAAERLPSADDDISAEEFSAAWRRFVADAQRDL